MKQYEGDGEGILKTVKNSIKTLTELLETQNEAVGLQVKKGAPGRQERASKNRM